MNDERRRMRRFRLPRVSTWIAMGIGFVGLQNLSWGVARMVAPEVEVLKAVDESGGEVSGLVRIFFGILLILLAKGVLECRRWAWGAALGLTSIVTLVNLYRVLQAGGIVVSGLVLPVSTVLVIAALLASHRRFSVRGSTRPSYGQIAAVIAVALALAYGIVGAYLLQDQFQGIQGWSDAAYFALVAYVTLGYDYDVAEIYPVGSDARWFAVSLFLIGVTLFVTALSVTLGPIVEGRMKGVVSLVKRFQRLSDHVVVCGYSGVAASVLDELRDRNVMAVIVDDREKVAQSLRGKGHDVLEEDPTLRETLLDANVLTAQAVIAAFDSDSTNTLVAVNAKDLRDATPNARFAILVRIEDEENVDKVRRLGVDQVISPSTLGGRLLAKQAVSPDAGSGEPGKPQPAT